MNTIEKEIVLAIINNLSDRSGLSNEWDNIDDDIKDEIIESWENIVIEKLKIK